MLGVGRGRLVDLAKVRRGRGERGAFDVVVGAGQQAVGVVVLEGDYAGLVEELGELFMQAVVERFDILHGCLERLKLRPQLADGTAAGTELNLQGANAQDSVPAGKALFLGTDEVGVWVDHEGGYRFIVTDFNGYLVGTGLGEGGSAASASSAPATTAATRIPMLQRPMSQIPLHPMQPFACWST